MTMKGLVTRWRALAQRLILPLGLAPALAFVFISVQAQGPPAPAAPESLTQPPTASVQTLSPLSSDPEAIATGFTPTAIARNATHLFVASKGHSPETCGLDPSLKTTVLRRMNFDGGNSSSLLERCSFDPQGMVVDEDNVYFRDQDNAIKKMPIAAPWITANLAENTCCGGLAQDDAYIYWGEWGEAGQNSLIRRVAKSGGAIQDIAVVSGDLQIHSLAVDDAYVYWTEGKIGNKLLNVPGSGAVKRAPKAGGPVEVLADVGDGIDNANGIALDDAYVYWTERGTGRVRRVAKSGGPVTDYLDADPNRMAEALAVNDTHIFWVDTTGGYDGRLRRVVKGGGAVDDLALGVLGPAGIVLTNTHVYWGQHGGLYRLPLDAPDVAVDLTIDAIEVTQVIQRWDNAVPLVAEKPALVRVYPRMIAPGGMLPGVKTTVRLWGYRNGQELPGSPLTPINPTLFVHTFLYRDSLDYSFNFPLPEEWRKGTVYLVAEINPDGAVKEFNKNNNLNAVTVTFQDKKPLCVEMVRVRTDPQTASVDDPGFWDIVDWLRGAYPAPEVLIDEGGTIAELQTCWAGPFPYACYGPYEMPDDENKVLARLGWYDMWHTHYAWQQCGKAHFYGMVHPSEMPAGGLGYRPGYQAWGVMTVDPDYAGLGQTAPWYAPHGGATLAHELGHNKGRKHVDCGGPSGTDPNYPNPPCDLAYGFVGGDWGFDYLDAAVINPTQAGDLMSYAVSVGKPRWLSRYTYEAIFNKIGDALATTTADAPAAEGATLAQRVLQAEEALAISGLITPTLGAAALDYAYRLPQGLVGPEKLQKLAESALVGSTARYSLRLLDDADHVLLQQPFDPPAVDDATGDERSFFMVTPYVTGAAAIALFEGETELTRRSVSPSPPQVTVLEPNGGESYADAMTIAWTAEDPDGDALRYTVQYSPDGGETWRVVVTDYFTTTLTLDDPSYLPGSRRALVRVIASDGVNTAFDTSDRVFSLRPHPPTAYISKPNDGAIFGLGEQVELLSNNWDEEDGALAGAALTWLVDGQPVGNGKELVIDGLSPGAHVITLRATDSDGMSAEDAVTIHVRRRECSTNNNRLEVVFLMDTSSSMAPYGDAVCRALPGVVDALADMGLDVRAQVVGVGGTAFCATQSVREIDPDTAARHPSDWGAATVSVAEHYPWAEGYTRLIAPVTNQGPEDGNPVEDPGPDREIIEQAIAAAREAGVSVTPLIMPPADSASHPLILQLAADLAEATAGGAVMQWDSRDLDIAGALEATQARVGCQPEVLGVWPSGDVNDTMELALTGRHLWAGVQVQVGGQPAQEVTPSPDGAAVTFRLPPGLPPGRYDLEVGRSGVGMETLTEAITVQSPGGSIYLPLVTRSQ